MSPRLVYAQRPHQHLPTRTTKNEGAQPKDGSFAGGLAAYLSLHRPWTAGSPAVEEERWWGRGRAVFLGWPSALPCYTAAIHADYWTAELR